MPRFVCSGRVSLGAVVLFVPCVDPGLGAGAGAMGITFGLICRCTQPVQFLLGVPGHDPDSRSWPLLSLLSVAFPAGELFLIPRP